MNLICELLDRENHLNVPYNRFKVYIKDRLGHDKRYEINTKEIKEELNWVPKYDFLNALSLTVKWYINNIDWCKEYFK